jgi:hypothetical protein
MPELERTDPVRYANLIRNMRLAAGAASLTQRQAQGTASHRGGRPKRYADRAAKQRAYRNRSRAAQTVTKPVAGPFIPLELQTPIQAPTTTIA